MVMKEITVMDRTVSCLVRSTEYQVVYVTVLYGGVISAAVPGIQGVPYLRVFPLFFLDPRYLVFFFFLFFSFPPAARGFVFITDHLLSVSFRLFSVSSSSSLFLLQAGLA